MIRRLTGTALGAGVVLAMAACGSSSSTTSGTGGSTGAGQPVSLEAQDFQFSPTTLTLPTGTTIQATVKNSGTAKHNFTIKELGVNQDLDPGSTHTVTFTTKTAATLVYYCEYHRDSKGMKGTLTVGAGGPAGAGTTSPAPSPANTPSNNPY
jgi:plastocyanin